MLIRGATGRGRADCSPRAGIGAARAGFAELIARDIGQHDALVESVQSQCISAQDVAPVLVIQLAQVVLVDDHFGNGVIFELCQQRSRMHEVDAAGEQQLLRTALSDHRSDDAREKFRMRNKVLEGGFQCRVHVRVVAQQLNGLLEKRGAGVHNLKVQIRETIECGVQIIEANALRGAGGSHRALWIAMLVTPRSRAASNSGVP